MAITSPFQGEDTGSIPVTRSSEPSRREYNPGTEQNRRRLPADRQGALARNGNTIRALGR